MRYTIGNPMTTVLAFKLHSWNFPKQNLTGWNLALPLNNKIVIIKHSVSKKIIGYLFPQTIWCICTQPVSVVIDLPEIHLKQTTKSALDLRTLKAVLEANDFQSKIDASEILNHPDVKQRIMNTIIEAKRSPTNQYIDYQTLVQNTFSKYLFGFFIRLYGLHLYSVKVTLL